MKVTKRNQYATGKWAFIALTLLLESALLTVLLFTVSIVFDDVINHYAKIPELFAALGSSVLGTMVAMSYPAVNYK